MKLTGINQLWVADITYIRARREGHPCDSCRFHLQVGAQLLIQLPVDLILSEQ
jgi:hypothetical protein